MPVEYNWVGDYEDPAKLKKEIRRGVCVFVCVWVSVEGDGFFYLFYLGYTKSMISSI